MNGDVIWGGIMVAIPFLPMTIFTLWVAVTGLIFDQECCGGLLLLTFLFPVAVLNTPGYMLRVLLAALHRLYNPMMKNKAQCLTFRMFEVVGESYPQALLGKLPLKKLSKFLARNILM